jgi:hypothetical protein
VTLLRQPGPSSHDEPIDRQAGEQRCERHVAPTPSGIGMPAQSYA